MARDRFLNILMTLHFSDNDQQPKGDRLFKIRKLHDYLRDKFKQLYVPNQNVSIDESLLLFEGRLSFKQYII